MTKPHWRIARALNTANQRVMALEDAVHNLTAERDALIKRVDALNDDTDALRADLQQTNGKLNVCGVVARCRTREELDALRAANDVFNSPSLQDVIRRVQREFDAIARTAELDRAINLLARLLAKAVP